MKTKPTSEMEQGRQSSMSRKTAIAGMAITSIAASDNWWAQAFIAAVGIVAIIVQAVLDWRKSGAPNASLTLSGECSEPE